MIQSNYAIVTHAPGDAHVYVQFTTESGRPISPPLSYSVPFRGGTVMTDYGHGPAAVCGGLARTGATIEFDTGDELADYVRKTLRRKKVRVTAVDPHRGADQQQRNTRLTPADDPRQAGDVPRDQYHSDRIRAQP